MPQTSHLAELLGSGAVWRGDQASSPAGNSARAVIPTARPELDGLLGGGWPRAALTELRSTQGLGAALLLPALARLSREGRWLVWVTPPCTPYGPALAQAGLHYPAVLVLSGLAPAEALWATEQALRSSACAAVLSWLPALQTAQQRRLQLAAAAGDCLGVVFQEATGQGGLTLAALRMAVQAVPAGCRVQVLKRPGGWGGDSLECAW